MLTWKDVIVEQQRRSDMMVQAGREKAKRASQTNHARSLHMYQRVMVHVGGWFVSLGCWLQTRYGAAAVGLSESSVTSHNEGFAGC